METALYGLLAVSAHVPAPSPSRAFHCRAVSRPRRGRITARSPHSGRCHSLLPWPLHKSRCGSRRTRRGIGWRPLPALCGTVVLALRFKLPLWDKVLPAVLKRYLLHSRFLLFKNLHRSVFRGQRAVYVKIQEKPFSFQQAISFISNSFTGEASRPWAVSLFRQPSRYFRTSWYSLSVNSR